MTTKNLLQLLSMAVLTFGIQSCTSSSAKQTAQTETKSCCEQTAKADQASCCSAENTQTKSCCSSSTQVAKADVQAYYFHATRRCATCQAVEKVTAETLKAKYEGKVSFASINREEEKDNPLLAKYKVNGQTLILVKGDEVVNLTNEAFMNARTNPEKLQAKLVSTIERLLN